MMERCVYPSLYKEINSVGLEEVEVYILRHQNTVAQYIDTCTILDLCLEVEKRPGARVTTIWWEHACLDLRKEDTEMGV